MKHRTWEWGLCAALVLSGCGGDQRDVAASAGPNESAMGSDGAVSSAAPVASGRPGASGSAGEGGGDGGAARPPAQPKVPLLTPDLIREVVRPQYQDMALCYQEGLSRDPKLAGTVEVSLTIAGDGSVIDARQKDVPAGKDKRPARHVDDPLTDAAVVSCVLTKFKALQFPASLRGMMTTVYPIVFATE